MHSKKIQASVASRVKSIFSLFLLVQLYNPFRPEARKATCCANPKTARICKGFGKPSKKLGQGLVVHHQGWQMMANECLYSYCIIAAGKFLGYDYTAYLPLVVLAFGQLPI